jgi:hypothetical protein
MSLSLLKAVKTNGRPTRITYISLTREGARVFLIPINLKLIFNCSGSIPSIFYIG